MSDLPPSPGSVFSYKNTLQQQQQQQRDQQQLLASKQ
jgi:hypothetical protein